MLEPTTFPMAISLLPFTAAVILTASSGALVPNATIVSPIIKDGIRRRLAIEEAPSTNQSAPFTSRKNPTNKKITDFNIIFLHNFFIFHFITISFYKENNNLFKKNKKSLSQKDFFVIVIKE